MDSDPPTADGFVALGSYSPKEAEKLLECFEQNGIAFQAQPRKSASYLNTDILVSVDLRQASEADQIHRDLFGDGLPNYDSSFFREERNLRPDDPGTSE